MKNLDLSRERHKCKNGQKTLCLCAYVPSAFLSAFTLLEIMIAMAIFGLVAAGTISVYIMCNKIWHTTALSMQMTRESSLALSRLVYGVGPDSGLRSAGMAVVSNISGGGWRLTISNLYTGISYAGYNSQQSNIYFPDTNSVICRNVSASSVTTNADGAVRVQLTVVKRDGLFAASNTVGTLVKMRNKP
ncbi:MAG: prepilin-type N-terminal cleavage/methylation domain-containing protein [Kiritimatiellae bacterium]|nr:prepilin-type N-terminal cleavage/methylation domain-containing protein [Kiritimatiellia bacterium]